MKAKHTEKRDNMEQISKLKRRIRERGDDMDNGDFDKIMMGKKGGAGKRGGDKRSVIDSVKDKVKQRQKQNNNFKKGKGKKRPGKVARQKGGKRR